ncbi:MauE/DoxX family redox-associated membrane protein [Maribacter sp. Hel_I_7]|uniref:DoxX family protein n=1 Tax=Maribacter sp. Hel_I_7 TaxID=1249997 RepID=UPI00047E0ADE|nr:MauE/DoxX family redox-associated membrane protein [Maribacter sp. Hel_I_7]
MAYPWHLYLMGTIYIIGGILHFIKPKVYLRIMPQYLPFHKPLVLLSGLAEIILGFGLFFKVTKDFSIYGIIAMLAVFLLVHFYMLSSEKAGAGFPKWVLLLRLPLQFALMYWAFIYLKV